MKDDIFGLAIRCLVMANHVDKWWNGNLIMRGSFATSIESLRSKGKSTTQRTRTALKVLRDIEFLTTKTTSQYTLVTIVNYDLYQDKKSKVTNKVTNNQQTDNKRITNGQQQLNNEEPCNHENKEHIESVFQHWNSEGVITHRSVGKFKECLSAALKTYSPDELKAAVSNYADILKSVDCYWSYKWNLHQFLTQKNGIDRFLPENFNRNDYLVRGNKGNQQPPPEKPFKSTKDFG